MVNVPQHSDEVKDIVAQYTAVMVFPEMEMSPEGPSKSTSPKTHIIKAQHGYAFEVKAGEIFRVVDLYGAQIIDFAAWVQGTDLVEKMSMSYTRHKLRDVWPTIGECLYTNRWEPILKVREDTVKVHDMTFMSCFPELYEEKGIKGHRSCATNIAEVMKPYGMGSYLEVTDPFNIFQYVWEILISKSLLTFITFVSDLADHVLTISKKYSKPKCEIPWMQ